MSSLPRLVALPYSPWSIRAKWALDHHGIAYRYVTYLPMLGEPLLKLWTRRLRGRSSVPVLLTREGPIEGSLAIARWADACGEASPLFSAERDDSIAEWNARADVMLDAGRALTIIRTLGSPAALAASVPGGRALGPIAAPIGALGARYLARKYGASADADRHREELRWGLAWVREAIGRGDHLLGAFSYADVTMVASTFFVRPPGEAIDHLGDAERACWTDELAGEFADVLAWRDRILSASFPRA
jgi:glutathione S-transferase